MKISFIFIFIFLISISFQPKKEINYKLENNKLKQEINSTIINNDSIVLNIDTNLNEINTLIVEIEKDSTINDTSFIVKKKEKFFRRVINNIKNN